MAGLGTMAFALCTVALGNICKDQLSCSGRRATSRESVLLQMDHRMVQVPSANSYDACGCRIGCRIGYEGWSSSRGRCSRSSQTSPEEAERCRGTTEPPSGPMPSPTSDACLCVFDIDRTLTGRQGDVQTCPRNRIIDEYDHGYDGGKATLSALSQDGISQTACKDCYLGICSAGSGSGASSGWNKYILDNIMRNELQDNLTAMMPEMSIWSYGTDVRSPYVLNQGNKIKQHAVEGIRRWYEARNINISPNNVYFFGDRTENIQPFKERGFNSREISCGSRDYNPKWYRGSGIIGYCGAKPEEIVREQGNILCE
eukprot:TRINITY_DN8164_c0_g1_i3.p1 TRINITY_DN8164_c0_g1~~TRINITY_DN8164_c0_g1_i3.p1  ORF type:complete len:314 (+),score=37.78 TRINITY_DN8164_c0_g1_i3:75-1016(+)